MQTRHWLIIAAAGGLLVMAGLAVWWIAGGSDDQASADPCGLVAAYGGIFESRSGVAIEVNDDNRPGLLERVHACVESALAEDAFARYRQRGRHAADTGRLDGRSG